MAGFVGIRVQMAWIAFRLLRITGLGSPRLAVRAWLLVSLPMLVTEVSELLLASVDFLFVAAWVGTSEAGLYFAAQRSISLVAFVNFAVGAAAASSVAGAVSDRMRLAQEVRRAATLAFWPSLAGALALVAAGPLPLALFGPQYKDGTSILAILAVGFVARSLVGPAEVLLSVIGAARACAAILVVHLVLAIVLNALLVPAFGIVGAAFAASLTMVSLSVGFAAYAWFSLGIVMVPSLPLLGLDGRDAGRGSCAPPRPHQCRVAGSPRSSFVLQGRGAAGVVRPAGRLPQIPARRHVRRRM
jgi:O-antigen/teichoic acid export membrane protein